MRTEFVFTKVRPIKKMFVIETNDYAAFSEIFLQIQDEIDAVFNLIFTNDNSLWSLATKDFVKRSDPDIILNLTNIDDDILSRHFGIFCAKPVNDQYKIGRFGTQLYAFTKKPSFLDKLHGSGDSDKVFNVISADKLENTSKALFACINFGLLEDEVLNRIHDYNVFNKITRTVIQTNEEAIAGIFNNESKFCSLTNDIGAFAGSGYGSSIYEIDYNKEGLFKQKDKKYLFVSDKNDFKTITFFWNTRSYYPYANIAWVPDDLLSDINSIVDDNSIFIYFDEIIEGRLTELFPGISSIKPERLHFEGRNERWAFLEHRQTISTTKDEIIIQHPVEKSFSDMGMGCAFVLETRGLREFNYPKHRNLGNLFNPIYSTDNFPLFEERFVRVSELGISQYVLEFTPMKAIDLVESIVLPDFVQVVHHLFQDIGYTIRKTIKSSIFEQTINLIGGISELKILASEKLFELIIALTPNVRTEKIAKTILEETLKLNKNEGLELLGEIRERGAIVFPSVTLTVDELLNKIPGTKSLKEQFIPALQSMYNCRMLLRGKFFDCPHCSSKLWIQIDSVARTNYCNECSNEIYLPIYADNKAASDHYRLNQLLIRAVDQGQLATLLLLNLFVRQDYRSMDYKSNLEVLENGTVLTDIDLFVKIGRKIGIAESKSASGFLERQVDDLISIGKKLRCDFVVFSCLLPSNSVEIQNLVTLLNQKSLDIPAFILTREILFNPRPNLLHRHFELHRSRDEFITGPIVIN